MQNLITIILSITSGVLVFIITRLLSEIKTLKVQKKTRDKAHDEAMLCLLRVKLIEYHDEFIKRERIPSYAYENWSKMFSAYLALGGNGLVKGMNDEIEKLPIT